MIRKLVPGMLLAALTVAGCSGDEPTAPGLGAKTIPLSYTFTQNAEDFTAIFSDYMQDMAGDLDTAFEYRELPAGLASGGKGLFLASHNRPDDLFMAVTRRLGPEDGIEPGVVYELELTVRIATNAAAGCAGIGGQPGESVCFKAGAAPVEPTTTADANGFVTTNLLKGGQSTGGPDAAVIGHIGNSSGDCSGGTWEFKTLTLEEFGVQAGPTGELWLVLGTESGFEGLTELYISAVNGTLRATALDSLPRKSTEDGGKL